MKWVDMQAMLPNRFKGVPPAILERISADSFRLTWRDKSTKFIVSKLSRVQALALFTGAPDTPPSLVTKPLAAPVATLTSWPPT